MKRKLIPIGSPLLAVTAALIGAGLSMQAADPEPSPGAAWGRDPVGGALQKLEVLRHDDGLDRCFCAGGARYI